MQTFLYTYLYSGENSCATGQDPAVNCEKIG